MLVAKTRHAAAIPSINEHDSRARLTQPNDIHAIQPFGHVHNHFTIGPSSSVWHSVLGVFNTHFITIVFSKKHENKSSYFFS